MQIRGSVEQDPVSASPHRHPPGFCNSERDPDKLDLDKTQPQWFSTRVSFAFFTGGRESF